MLDTILKLFGSLGIVLLFIQLFEWLFYRRMKGRGHLLLDLRGASEQSCMEHLDLLSSTLQKCCAKALIEKTYVLTNEKTQLPRESLVRALRRLDLNVVLLTEDRAADPYKNSSSFSQENPTAEETRS